MIIREMSQVEPIRTACPTIVSSFRGRPLIIIERNDLGPAFRTNRDRDKPHYLQCAVSSGGFFNNHPNPMPANRQMNISSSLISSQPNLGLAINRKSLGQITLVFKNHEGWVIPIRAGRFLINRPVVHYRRPILGWR